VTILYENVAAYCDVQNVHNEKNTITF